MNLKKVRAENKNVRKRAHLKYRRGGLRKKSINCEVVPGEGRRRREKGDRRKIGLPTGKNAGHRLTVERKP